MSELFGGGEYVAMFSFLFSIAQADVPILI